MIFEPGYLETDVLGAICPMIRAADSVLEYSHVLERRTPKRIGNSSWNVANSRNSRIDFRVAAPKQRLFQAHSVRFPSNSYWHTSSVGTEAEINSKMTSIRSRGAGVGAPKLPECVPSALSRNRLWFSETKSDVKN